MSLLRVLHLDSPNIQQQIKTIRQAAVSTGCLFIRGSQFEESIENLSRVQSQLDTLFNKTQEEKSNLGVISGRGATRGFFSIGAETGDKNNIENKESFSFGMDGIPCDFIDSCPLVANNIYPYGCQPEQFQILLKKFNQTCIHVVTLLQLAFPQLPILGTLDQSSFYQSFIRAFRYYPLDADQVQDKQQIGNSLHTDWNLLTLVYSDQPGLEVLYDDQYIEYNDMGGKGLVCNFGDFLSSVSDGVLQSPWHRVTISQQTRNSLVYFGYPRSSHPVVTNRVYNQGRLLGLFVDQSGKEKSEWEVPDYVQDMGEMYAAKWKQVANDN